MTQNKTELIITALDQTSAGLNKAKGQINGFSKDVEGLGGKLKGVDALFAGLGVTLSVGVFAAWVKGAIDTADELGKMSQKVGVSVENLSALKYAGELADVGLDQLSVGMKQFNKNIVEAAAGSKGQVAAFEALGIEIRDTNGVMRSSYDLFGDVADRFQTLEDSELKTTLAMKLFGKSGADLIPLLNSGSIGLSEMRSEAERLGLVMSTQTTQAAEQFNDNLTRLESKAKGLAFTLAETLLPELVRITDNLNKIAQAKGPAGKFQAWIDTGWDDKGPGFAWSTEEDKKRWAARMGKFHKSSIHSATAEEITKISPPAKTAALEKYLASLQGDSAARTAKTSAARIAAEAKRQDEELRRSLDNEARRPGGLYEMAEIDDANQRLANFQGKLQMPALAQPSFNLGFQDVMFKSLDQQQDEVQSTSDELDRLAKKYDETFGIKIPTFLDGAEAAWSDYNKHAQDSTSQAFWAVTDSLQTLEDSLVDFVTTGKFEFDDLAKSIISSLAKIAAQKYLSNIGNDIMGFFGGGSGGIAVDGVSTLDWLMADAHHTGGIVGSEASFSRPVPASLFANAPRYHNGLFPGEYPAILKQGEGVFTDGQMKALGSRGKAAPAVTINIKNESGTQVDAEVKDMKIDWENLQFTLLLKKLNSSPSARSSLKTAIGG